VTLGQRIPIEPLEEERLVAIERAVVSGASDRLAHPTREPRRFLVLAAALVAASAAGIVGWRLHDAPVAPVFTPSDPPALAVRTEAERATIDIGDARITSDPATAFRVTRPDGGVLVTLERGRVELAVDKRGARPPLVVRAGETDVEVVGTRFSVDYDGLSAIAVRVDEGKVKVTHQQRVQLIGAGSEWKSSTGVVAAIEPRVVASAPVAPVPPPAPVPDRAPALHDRVAAAPPPPARAKAQKIERRAAAAEQPARGQAAIAADPYVDLKVAIRKQPIAFDPKLDGNGDAAAEIARLKKVAYSPTTLGGDASAALYRIAVLLHKPLKQDAEALRTLDIYRRRFSRGRELDAALWLRVRILCGRAIDDDCRQAAYSYEEKAPNGSGGEVAVRITNAP
jgi:hypothetical protein